jgi:hypothetical protein
VKDFLDDAFAFVKVLLGLAVLAAVAVAFQVGCAEFNSTKVPCDPQTAYDHCEPGLDTYTR